VYEQVLSEASLIYEAGLQQHSASGGQSSAAKPAASAASFDAWEKFSLDGEEAGATASASATVDVVAAPDAFRESSQV
jgi:hypothetical protein